MLMDECGDGSQAPPGQAPPGQAPPGQAPLGQASPGPSRRLQRELERYCGKSVSNHTQPDKFAWHFYNSVFFVITVVSTIGYGNLAPTCTLSRNLMIGYALLGIPMIGILLTHMADYFGKFFLRAHHRYKMHRYENRLGLIGNILLYLVPGFLVFIICPAVLFSIFEDWKFDEGVYFAFVTLTTIGFGDLVAGQGDEESVTYVLYKVFLIFWVIFGLGYLVMVLGFITRAMRSKRMTRLEHKLARNLKQTQTKLWNGFCSEMGYVRRVLNELYLLKLKPVYHGDDESLGDLQPRARSASCPDLLFLVGPRTGPGGPGDPRGRSAPRQRQRAQSEVLPGLRGPLLRRRSETELARIDRRATFADTSAPADGGLDPAELLHEFMNAIVNWGGAAEDEYQGPGSAHPSGGYLGFSEADILHSERLGVPRRARARAASLVPFPSVPEHKLYGYPEYPDPDGDPDGDADGQETITASGATKAEWTWSGAAASRRVHELIRARRDRRRSEAVIRQQERYDQQLHELQQFQHLQHLRQLRQRDKELRQLQRRLERRSRSTSAPDPGLGPGPGEPGQLPDRGGQGGGLMQRLAIPQCLKGLARRGSLQPTAPAPAPRGPSPWPPAPDSGPLKGHKFRSASCDAPEPLLPDPYRTYTGCDQRRRSVFNMRRNSATVHPVLENTSLADFLRALQSVHSQAPPCGQAPQPCQGTMNPPGPQAPASIFNLWGDSVTKAEKRRFSLRPVVLHNSAPGADEPKAPAKRRMSFWPMFGADSSQTLQPTRPAGPGRGRKLSALFGAPELADSGPAKVVKKRRFSIWPTLGTLGAAKTDEKEKQADLHAAENGSAPLAAVPTPQITISYVDRDRATPTEPSAALPLRESLRRVALTSHLGPSVPAPYDVERGPKIRFHRTSLSEVTTIKADAPNVAPGLLPGIRRPSAVAPGAAAPINSGSFRRRANSDSTRTWRQHQNKSQQGQQDQQSQQGQQDQQDQHYSEKL